MLQTFNFGGRSYGYDLSRPIDISIPLRFNGPQPNAYGVAAAASSPCRSGDLVGDTREGGSCNFEQYTLIPHCNGTHTECVGHITHERISIIDCLQDAFLPADLVTIEPIDAGNCNESYTSQLGSGDRLVTRSALDDGLVDVKPSAALIVRTTPNSDARLTDSYSEDNIPAYFTTEAIELIVERGYQHLVVDLPSIDRLFDEGRLSNHRRFWKIEPGSFELTEIARRSCTITELALVPNNVEDGRYLLNLQIAPFASDASPSRPILFRLVEN